MIYAQTLDGMKKMIEFNEYKRALKSGQAAKRYCSEYTKNDTMPLYVVVRNGNPNIPYTLYRIDPINFHNGKMEDVTAGNQPGYEYMRDHRIDPTDAIINAKTSSEYQETMKRIREDTDKIFTLQNNDLFLNNLKQKSKEASAKQGKNNSQAITFDDVMNALREDGTGVKKVVEALK